MAFSQSSITGHLGSGETARSSCRELASRWLRDRVIMRYREPLHTPCARRLHDAPKRPTIDARSTAMSTGAEPGRRPRPHWLLETHCSSKRAPAQP